MGKINLKNPFCKHINKTILLTILTFIKCINNINIMCFNQIRFIFWIKEKSHHDYIKKKTQRGLYC